MLLYTWKVFKTFQVLVADCLFLMPHLIVSWKVNLSLGLPTCGEVAECIHKGVRDRWGGKTSLNMLLCSK